MITTLYCLQVLISKLAYTYICINVNTVIDERSTTISTIKVMQYEFINLFVQNLELFDIMKIVRKILS